MKPILWGLILGLALAALLFLIVPALAHGEHNWMRNYSNGEISCCHETDVEYIPHWKAENLRIGDTYTGHFFGGERTVTIKKIFPTEDKQGRAAVTYYGCLFKAFGM